MAGDAKDRADARLAEGLEQASVADPRPLYRERMRWLKQRDAAAFDEALRYYEDTLVPGVAEGADPLEAWLDYGRKLAELGGPGRLVEVDDVGRARAWDGSGAPAGVLLFVPDGRDARPFALSVPRPASPAQQATVQLLVEGRREFNWKG